MKGAGVSIVIYANHLLRSSYSAMKDLAKIILTNRRAKEAEALLCTSVVDLFKVVEK